MRKVYSFIAALIVSAVAMATYAQNYRSVVVDMTDGSQTMVALEEGLTTKFVGAYVIFDSPTSSKVVLVKANIVSMSFSETSGIADVVSDSTAPVYGDGVVSFRGLPADSSVDMYDMSGRRLMHADASGDYTLSLGDLTPGIYIVTVNRISYKISVK